MNEEVLKKAASYITNVVSNIDAKLLIFQSIEPSYLVCNRYEFASRVHKICNIADIVIEKNKTLLKVKNSNKTSIATCFSFYEAAINVEEEIQIPDLTHIFDAVKLTIEDYKPNELLILNIHEGVDNKKSDQIVIEGSKASSLFNNLYPSLCYKTNNSPKQEWEEHIKVLADNWWFTCSASRGAPVTATIDYDIAVPHTHIGKYVSMSRWVKYSAPYPVYLLGKVNLIENKKYDKNELLCKIFKV